MYNAHCGKIFQWGRKEILVASLLKDCYTTQICSNMKPGNVPSFV